MVYWKFTLLYVQDQPTVVKEKPPIPPRSSSIGDGDGGGKREIFCYLIL